ncbi:hypothetical protein Taro_007983 [Colocasia esculenta]|uniref:Uncharacterized protein n=1 Tax=Colocasia esculenta TaxID=4460 RepID=A0A843TSN1_COLES|nr:hypothetical protein [Colocasia esculenta]
MPAIKVEPDDFDSTPVKIKIENGDYTGCVPARIDTKKAHHTGYASAEIAPVKFEKEYGGHTNCGGSANMDIEETKCDDQNVPGTRKAQKKIYGPSKRPAKFSFVKPILHEHRRRLVCLINKLAKRHKWKDASGALSTLLKGTPHGCSILEDRKHFLVAMELLRRFGNAHDYNKRIKQIYEVWMNKLVWRRKCSKKVVAKLYKELRRQRQEPTLLHVPSEIQRTSGTTELISEEGQLDDHLNAEKVSLAEGSRLLTSEGSYHGRKGVS